MIIKLFTMVKDEIDIVEDWLKYHGTLFGYKNLYIVDNMSDDGTFEKIQEYQSKGVFLIQREDYKLKGDYMTELINDPNRGDFDFAYPIDIDEFVVYYDKESNQILPFRTVNYFKSLPVSETVFKTNYINSLISNGNDVGYERATVESEIGLYQDYHDVAKSFFNKRIWTGELDHGNHYQTTNFVLTDLCLVHYHCRNLEQMKKKVINNVKGLGYDTTNIEILRENEDGVGYHHVKHMIDILNNEFAINTNSKSGEKNIVSLKPLAEFISGL
jgi:hypothetical protein